MYGWRYGTNYVYYLLIWYYPNNDPNNEYLQNIFMFFSSWYQCWLNCKNKNKMLGEPLVCEQCLTFGKNMLKCKKKALFSGNDMYG